MYTGVYVVCVCGVAVRVYEQILQLYSDERHSKKKESTLGTLILVEYLLGTDVLIHLLDLLTGNRG